MGTNEKILEILKNSGKPMKSAELAAESGLDKKDVDKALKELKKNGLVNCPKTCYYSTVK